MADRGQRRVTKFDRFRWGDTRVAVAEDQLDIDGHRLHALSERCLGEVGVDRSGCVVQSAAAGALERRDEVVGNRCSPSEG